MTLPPEGTAARASLERDALTIAANALHEQSDRIADSLYIVYSTFRLRFLEERGLMDRVPGRDADSVEALQDARTLERYVASCWGNVLLAIFER